MATILKVRELGGVGSSQHVIHTQEPSLVIIYELLLAVCMVQVQVGVVVWAGLCFGSEG